jgi:uncharacterized protein
MTSWIGRNKNDYFVTLAMTDGLKSASETGALAALISRAVTSGKGLPPVERWNPPFCGDIDMAIKADGTWFYMGTPIGRAPLVRLFSTVLRKDEDGRTYLVTPVEKVGITIEDAPFTAVEMAREGDGLAQKLTFRTNVGDVAEAGEEHGLRFEFDPVNQGLKPYLHVRGRLEARLARPVMYELIALGEEVEHHGEAWFAVRSGGVIFPIMEAARLRELSL